MFSSYIKKNKFYVYLTAVIFVSLLSLEAKAQNQVKVKGDGFEIGEKYIEALANFYASGFSFTTTSEQYLSMAARIKLFSHEAKAINLEPQEINFEAMNINIDDPVKKEVSKDFAFAEAFLSHVVANYEIDNKIIESFYRSNPDKFREGPWKGADVIPLDSDLKESLRRELLKQSRNRIANETYNSLKGKYEVHIMD